VRALHVASVRREARRACDAPTERDRTRQECDARAESASRPRRLPGPDDARRPRAAERGGRTRGASASPAGRGRRNVAERGGRAYTRRLLGALAHLPPAAHEAASALFLPLPPHGRGGLLPGVGLVPHVWGLHAERARRAGRERRSRG
jgi:hypothetical protein